MENYDDKARMKIMYQELCDARKRFLNNYYSFNHRNRLHAAADLLTKIAVLKSSLKEKDLAEICGMFFDLDKCEEDAVNVIKERLSPDLKEYEEFIIKEIEENNFKD